jgi:hypothetical protein
MDFRKKIKIFVKKMDKVFFFVVVLFLILLIENFSGGKKHAKMELLINLISKEKK